MIQSENPIRPVMTRIPNYNNYNPLFIISNFSPISLNHAGSSRFKLSLTFWSGKIMPQKFQLSSKFHKIPTQFYTYIFQKNLVYFSSAASTHFALPLITYKSAVGL